MLSAKGDPKISGLVALLRAVGVQLKTETELAAEYETLLAESDLLVPITTPVLREASRLRATQNFKNAGRHSRRYRCVVALRFSSRERHHLSATVKHRNRHPKRSGLKHMTHRRGARERSRAFYF